MPIVAASNGIKPAVRALAVIQLNKPVTPKAINDCVGTGDYAAKYISQLRNRYGFTFTVQKDGREVVSYTCVGEPANVADLRAMKPKTKTVNPSPKAKAAKVVNKTIAKKVAKAILTPEQIKAKNLETMRKVTAKNKAVKAAAKKVKTDFVEKALGSTGEIATSFSIDAGFDSMENVNVKDFLR